MVRAPIFANQKPTAMVKALLEIFLNKLHLQCGNQVKMENFLFDFLCCCFVSFENMRGFEVALNLFIKSLLQEDIKNFVRSWLEMASENQRDLSQGSSYAISSGNMHCRCCFTQFIARYFRYLEISLVFYFYLLFFSSQKSSVCVCVFESVTERGRGRGRVIGRKSIKRNYFADTEIQRCTCCQHQYHHQLQSIKNI